MIPITVYFITAQKQNTNSVIHARKMYIITLSKFILSPQNSSPIDHQPIGWHLKPQHRPPMR